MTSEKLDKVLAAVRSVGMVGGAGLVGNAATTAPDFSSLLTNVQTLIGSVMAIAAIVAQIWSYWGQKKVASAAIVVQSPQQKDINA